MHPNKIIRRQYLVQLSRKMLIDSHIASEIPARKFGNVQPVVKNRPQDAIGKSVVVFLEILLDQVSHYVRLIAALDRPHRRIGFYGDPAAPAEPDSGMPLQDRPDRDRESARAVVAAWNNNAISHNDKARHAPAPPHSRNTQPASMVKVTTGRNMAQARANLAAMRLLQHATAADFEDQ